MTRAKTSRKATKPITRENFNSLIEVAKRTLQNPSAPYTTQAIAIAFTLADHLGKNEKCFPSLKTIARETRMSLSTVKKHLPLVTEGEYAIFRKTPGGNGWPRSNHYEMIGAPAASATADGEAATWEAPTPIAHRMRSDETGRRVEGRSESDVIDVSEFRNADGPGDGHTVAGRRPHDGPGGGHTVAGRRPLTSPVNSPPIDLPQPTTPRVHSPRVPATPRRDGRSCKWETL